MTFPRGQWKGEKASRRVPESSVATVTTCPSAMQPPCSTWGRESTPLVRSRGWRRRSAAAPSTSSSSPATPPAPSRTAAWSWPSPRPSRRATKPSCAPPPATPAPPPPPTPPTAASRPTSSSPSGRIAQGKLAQAVAHGAKIIAIDGNFDDALRLARRITDKHPVALVNSVNPYRIEGQKTAAFEIVDALGDAPDYLFIPVGNAGNITAYWRGFLEYYRLREANKRPRMMGFQAAGAAPIVRGQPVEDPQTIATAIRIGNPASWESAVAARDESGGVIDAVTDDEILDAYYRLAREEGIFGEPASAASVAGLLKVAREGLSLAGQTVVCVITGNGLKDPDTAMSAKPDLHELPADLAAIEKAMGWA